jgi:hypothetical protein
MNSINHNLTNIEAFDDFFTVVISYLNPKEHCQTARVCKKLNSLVMQLWLQQEHDTVQNRKWLTELYLIKTEDPNGKLESIKMSLTQLISTRLYMQLTAGAQGQNDARALLIRERGGLEELMKQISLETKHTADLVIDRHQEIILFSLRKSVLESFVKYYSLAQIKKFIENQSDPINCALMQNMAQFGQPSLNITKKLIELNDEIDLEVKALAETVALPSNVDRLIQPLSKMKIDNSLNIIDFFEPQEDTMENRVLWIERLCKDTDYLSSMIEGFNQQIFTNFLIAFASMEKIEIEALPKKKVCKFKQLIDQAHFNKYDRIHSTFKELSIEQISEVCSITEIKKLIEIYQDPLQLAVIRLQPQIMHEIGVSNEKLMNKMMREMLTEMNVGGDVIDAFCGVEDVENI